MSDDDSTKTVRVAAGIWYNKDTDSIHIALDGFQGAITTVNRKAGSKRCHENLFTKLSRCLKQEGKPFPANVDDPLDPPVEHS